MGVNGKITISRPQCSSGEEYISMSFEDDEAGTTFLRLKISLEDLMKALTGLANVECDMEFRGLENVGKKIERDTLEFPLPESVQFRDKQATITEAKRVCPEGWSSRFYFGSQDSYFSKDSCQWARCSIVRWIDNH